MKKRIIAVLTMIMMGMVLVSCTGDKNEDKSGNTEKIRIGTSGGYQPYTFLDENDELMGFDVDVWREIGKRTGKEIEFKRADFSGLFGMLDNGQIDTIANQITITDERLQKYSFTDGYVYYGAQLVTNKNDDSIKTLEDLKGKKIGVSLGSNYEKLIKAFDKEGEIEVVTYDGPGLYQEVALKRVDAVLMDKLSALKAIEKLNIDIKISGEPVEELVNAFPFLKNEKNTELLKEVNKAMIEMKEDGTLSEISLKWFPIDITKK